MAFEKKTWKNRQSEHPNRRTLTKVSGQENSYDVERDEGLVLEEGDAFDQETMNDLESRIAAGFESDGVGLYSHAYISEDKTHLMFGKGGNIKFVATAGFTEGDKFNLNDRGEFINGYTVSGEPLWTGFFKAGRTVTCSYDGESLTFNGGGGLSAEEAAKLTPGNIKTGVSITANGKTVTGSFTADATAAAGQILSGKTAYVNGQKVTGTIPSQAAQRIVPGTADKTIAAGLYLSGQQTIAGDADLKAENIRSGMNLFGVTGSFKGDIKAIGFFSISMHGQVEFNKTLRGSVRCSDSSLLDSIDHDGTQHTSNSYTVSFKRAATLQVIGNGPYELKVGGTAMNGSMQTVSVSSGTAIGITNYTNKETYKPSTIAFVEL